MTGTGCQQCANNISVKELKWLDGLGVPRQGRNEYIPCGDRKIKPDGYDKSTNTVYEFHGNYYHGNPAIYDAEQINPTRGLTYGELYQNTLEREARIRNAGYNLITIWESEWDAQQKEHKRLAQEDKKDAKLEATTPAYLTPPNPSVNP
jgi:hypothetical protein